MLSLRPKCTCGGRLMRRHFLSCDLMYTEGKSFPKKRKRFFLFYPLIKKRLFY